MPCGSGYPRACGSRFNAYPCRSGPPRLDADGNVIPQRTTLCGDLVCTQSASFATDATVGSDALLAPGQLSVNGVATVTGDVIVNPVPGNNGGGLAVTYGASAAVQADLFVDQLSSVGPGGSLVFYKSSSLVPEPNAQGGRLDVVFDSAAGVATASGFRYTSQPASFYVAGGTGVWYEEKNYAAFGGAIPATMSECVLQTTVLTAGTSVLQQLSGASGVYVRVSGASGAWGAWTAVVTFAVPP